MIIGTSIESVEFHSLFKRDYEDHIAEISRITLNHFSFFNAYLKNGTCKISCSSIEMRPQEPEIKPGALRSSVLVT